MSHTGGFRFQVVVGEVECLDRDGQWKTYSEVVRYNTLEHAVFRVGDVVFAIQPLAATREVRA